MKGKLRTYKIHLGSGNILMEPNDQYLCIVPSRSGEIGGGTTGGSVFLPFEGDRTLSIILSKALMLAEDDTIKERVDHAPDPGELTQRFWSAPQQRGCRFKGSAGPPGGFQARAVC